MKRLIVASLLLSTAAAAFAADDVPPVPRLNEKIEKFVVDALPVCSEPVTTSRTGLAHKLPVNMTGLVVRVESKRQQCEGQYVDISTDQGSFFSGLPWFLDGMPPEAKTLEQKLKTFTWESMHQNFTPEVDHTTKQANGLLHATLWQTTEAGRVPLYGEIDPAGTVFFFGRFFPTSVPFTTSRMKEFEPFMKNQPTEGAADAAVTVVEFSDFECPSCQHAAGYLDPIVAKYGSKVKYVRYDLPLTSMHPWAFSAAVGGRAIWRQKPALFWEYKKQVYANQEKLTAFTIDDFARNFAQDHELDLKKFDADVASKELREEILKGVGTAFSNDVRSTPTYVVNGIQVDPGTDGKYLEEYVAKLVK